jgi:hypothetical protein
LRARVSAAVDRGLGREIVSERALAGYVALTLTLGDDFVADPRNPWAAPIFQDPKLDDDQKIQRLLQAWEAQAAAPVRRADPVTPSGADEGEV